MVSGSYIYRDYRCCRRAISKSRLYDKHKIFVYCNSMKDQLYFSQKQLSHLVITECAPCGLYFLVVIFEMTIISIQGGT